MKSIKNNLYMLRLIWEVCPFGVVCELLHQIINRAEELFYSVFLLRFIVKAIESGTEFSGVVLLLFTVLAYGIVTNVFRSWYWHWYRRKVKINMEEHLLEKMYQKAIECDLSCYENPEFYDKYTRASSEILKRGMKILENCSRMAGGALTAIGSICIIAAWEPIVIPIVIVCAIGSILIDKKRSKMKYDCYVETTSNRRTDDYVKRVVYLQDYARQDVFANFEAL